MMTDEFKSVYKETTKHKLAFDFYYNLGPTRNIDKVAEEFKVSRTAVGNWSSKFNWKDRVQSRVIEEASILKMEACDAVTNAKYRLAIAISKTVNSIENNINSNKVDLTDIKDIIAVYNQLEKIDTGSNASEDTSDTIVINDSRYTGGDYLE